MKKRVNKISVFFMLIIGIWFLAVSKPLYGKAVNVENTGNLLGLKERIVHMQEDLWFLNDEIEQLRQECER